MTKAQTGIQMVQTLDTNSTRAHDICIEDIAPPAQEASDEQATTQIRNVRDDEILDHIQDGDLAEECYMVAGM